MNTDIKLMIRQNSTWLAVDQIDENQNVKRLYFDGVNGVRVSSIPVSGWEKYPGYLEWVNARIFAGNMSIPCVTDWRKEMERR